MTTLEALTRLRAMLDEANAGYFLDSTLYKYLDNAQSEIINILKEKQNLVKISNPDYESEALKVLLKSAAIGPASKTGMNLPSDWLFDHSMQVSDRTATLFPYNEYLKREESEIQKATSLYPSYAIKGNLIFFTPLTSSSTCAYTYYSKPSEITGAAVSFKLGSETHQAIVLIAYAYALIQDNRSGEAGQSKAEAFNLIKDL